MAKQQKSFIKGRMNKDVDERLLPDGEYVDAQNVRLGSTELSEVGAVENSKGNTKLTTLQYDGVALSNDAECIGAYADDARETIYWFVHDPNNPQATGGVVDMIVSFNTNSQQLTYHVVSATAAVNEPTTLNFNPQYRLGEWNVDIIDDLLFWTDNYNQPRKINVNRAYPQPVAHVDQFTELDISVIKPQPIESPTIELQETSEDSNYIEDGFFSFAYRYKYKDGEYSATSQFSQPAFFPKDFALEASSMTNSGMENKYNLVIVGFNTGGENVVGIDVLYKECDSNVIYVAKKLNKSQLNIPNNTQDSISFTNGDIYTILNEGEILRLYDNVPRLAGSQTVFGNRVMYSNYLEGRDLIDSNGDPVNINYTVERVSSKFVSGSLNYGEPDANSFQYNLTGTPITIQDAFLVIDTSGRPVEDYSDESILEVTMTFEPAGLYNSAGLANNDYDLGDEFTISFLYNVTGNNTSAYQAYNTPQFENQVGPFTFQQSPNNWNLGYTLTDIFNAATATPTPIDPQVTPELTPIRSARDVASPSSEGIKFAPIVDNTIHLTPNAIQYAESANSASDDYYQFFKITNVDVNFTKTPEEKSLHSNRDYQVGIVYQDAEGRQTTVFESIGSTVHIDDKYSSSANRIKATIPVTMHPPSWADRYKFVAKQNRTDYETVYGIIAYKDAISSNYWIKLDGEQSNKVSVGQTLIVKSDANGPLEDNVKATVLDIVSQPDDFIDDDANDTVEFAGVYAKFLPEGWTVNAGSDSLLTSGTQYEFGIQGNFPDALYYELYTETPDPVNPLNPPIITDWEITVGSVVDIEIIFKRRERGNLCGSEVCEFRKQVVSSQTYADFSEFWINEGVNISEADCSDTNDDSGPNSNIFYPNVYELNNPSGTLHVGNATPDVNKVQFVRGTNNGLNLVMRSGTRGCNGVTNPQASSVQCKISVRKAESVIVFETEPSKTVGETYFENEQSFPIVNGFHMSGDLFDDQDQTASQHAIVNLTFFNCFTFFNGVESYKVKDSIFGSKFYLGNRVTAVSEQDYREIRRFASITYSGIYNAQNNVNRLNEFNLGLSNYKDCEISFGPIEVIHGRRTDLLTIQEDRVSYVTIGKNLLSDATGDSVLTSVPEVLGTQVARTEEYGISRNPESFVSEGADIYFTDAKRSSVLQLKGGSSSESLNVISDIGMRTWFRDMFQTAFDYQKLGGYDPYMDEYVLSPRTERLPVVPVVYECGGGQIQFTGLTSIINGQIDFGNGVGEVTIDISATNSVQVDITYRGTTHTASGTGSLQIVFDKDTPQLSLADLVITPTDPSVSSITYITIGCPVADTMSIIPVVLNSTSNSGDTNRYQWGYTNPTLGYGSTISSYLVFLSAQNNTYQSENIVSQFGPTYTGQKGTGMFPVDNSTFLMQSFRPSTSGFVYNPNVYSLRYYVQPAADPAYQNNALDIGTLIANSTVITPVTGSDPLYEATFNTGSLINNGDRLYLIWDYRESNELKLCYSNSSDISEACCECFSSDTCVPFLGTTIEASSAAACALSPTTTYYTTTITSGGVTNTQPIVGTTVYDAGGCSQQKTVDSGFIKLTDNTWVEVNSSGVVTNTGNC